VDRSDEIERLVKDGAGRLLARASDSRSLNVDVLAPRIRAGVEKYLLRDDPDTPAAELKKFVDEMQADDLCLIIACERGDESAWTDLVERFTVTVRSAARSATANEDAAEDLAQSIWAELHGLRVREDGRPASKLAYYSGRGSLAGWLRAVVAQLSVDAFRKQSKLVQTEEETDLERLASDAHLGETTTFAAAELKPGQTRKETEGVFVVRSGKAEFVPIKMGIAGDKYFEVLSGLKDGDQVITGPYNSVRGMVDGDLVRIDNERKTK
jgi:DNA-directed RNA polymerase specialized sigma24 family protein